MSGRGGGGIVFGKISVYSQSETLDEMRKQLGLILKEFHYPDFLKDSDSGVEENDDVREEEISSEEIVERMKEEDEMEENDGEEKGESKKFMFKQWAAKKDGN